MELVLEKIAVSGGRVMYVPGIKVGGLGFPSTHLNSPYIPWYMILSAAFLFLGAPLTGIVLCCARDLCDNLPSGVNDHLTEPRELYDNRAPSHRLVAAATIFFLATVSSFCSPQEHEQG